MVVQLTLDRAESGAPLIVTRVMTTLALTKVGNG
jgi:hypothetical protein